MLVLSVLSTTARGPVVREFGKGAKSSAYLLVSVIIACWSERAADGCTRHTCISLLHLYSVLWCSSLLCVLYPVGCTLERALSLSLLPSSIVHTAPDHAQSGGYRGVCAAS